MTKFYTYASVLGNNILHRGYRDGKKFTEKVPFSPKLFVKAKKKTEFKSLYDDQYLEVVDFTDIRDAKDFLERYKDVAGFDVHGFTKWQYQFINREYNDEIEYDVNESCVLTLDLEVVDEEQSGFPDIQTANFPIVLISLHDSMTDETIVLGLKDYVKNEDDNFEYIKLSSEKELLKYFVAYNMSKQPDIWTGWNTDEFDIPYLINRIARLFGTDMVKKLSPFGHVREKKVYIRGEEVQTYDIGGIVSLDYLQLYKKFTYNALESYALGFVATHELGVGKVELPGDSFKDAYINHFQTFVKYNAVDTLRVKEIDEKMKLIELVFSLAFLYKCNLQDVFRTVLPWEVFIYNHLSKKGIQVPPRKHNLEGEVEGAWVKEPIPGMYGWSMSFDFASLYPSIIRQWNISPETFVDDDMQDALVDDFIAQNKKAIEAQDFAHKHDLSLAANGACFRKDRQGFLAELMEIAMVGRKVAKKEMLALESEYQKTHDPSLTPKIAALNNRQLALKIAANSAYGAIGNSGFHYYDYRMAEAITLTGQLSDKHLAFKMNGMFNKMIKTTDVDYVITADTDSIYMNCQPMVDKYCAGWDLDKIVKFLDKFGESECQRVINLSVNMLFDRMNAFQKVMASKREAIASKGLFRAKKNYAMYVHNSEGVAYNPPKLKVMGIEIVRSSTPQWCRVKLKELLQLMFEKDERALQKRFSEVKANFMALPPEDVAFPRGVSDVDKWTDTNTIYKKGAPIHVRGALLYNTHFSGEAPIQNGDKIKFIYLKLPNTIKENCISFPSKFPKPLLKYVDYDLQFEKTFLSPLQSLTTCAGWHVEEQVSLEDALFG